MGVRRHVGTAMLGTVVVDNARARTAVVRNTAQVEPGALLTVGRRGRRLSSTSFRTQSG